VSRRAPVIGLTTYGPEGELDSVSLPIAYLNAVASAGGIPVLLGPSGAATPRVLDALDALVLPGGGDLDPANHVDDQHEAVYGVVPERDAFELELLRVALERPELPVLGICRGMQILNVALGGDLELHIPDARGEAVVHRLPPRVPTFHPVRVDPSSVLGEIYGREEFPVCSWHHQEVRRLGRKLEPIAWAPDGVIEGLVYTGHPFAIAVQWHPELQVADDPLQRRLFSALVERARP
jgi:putative glutamine amidotransferase